MFETIAPGYTSLMRLLRRSDGADTETRPNGPGDGESLPEEAPTPQPERHERELRDPEISDLSRRDWKAVFLRAAKETKADNVTDIAAALAYYAFLAIPAALLVSLGVFSVLAGPETIDRLLEKLGTVVPAETIELLEESLTRAIENQSGGLVMIVLGFLLALWTTTGAMNALMRGLNRVYDRDETRGFVKQRVTALGMLVCMLLAFALSFGLLVLGPVISDWLGGLLGLESAFGWIWWTLQWPILVGGLLLAFAGILFLGPNVDHPRWRFLTLGSGVAVAIWIVASGLFAVYVSLFATYNKAWGSLAAVIIMLTWLWLSALSLLFGAEINAEAERSRELREGRPAEIDLQAPAKA
ncbi:MAG TPA: YihY/virulence factor BrkB family protein [Gaiellaceae bacterium]|nr:YihY/virulence factor BrkB family protein [Gaiellaceae bacterium]